ncbi:MAG TPA: hypothetical protein VFF68_07615, partial [Anaerolineaceae bacterium]|nr:hypothetical protein [Anaerolineaceae bacterium]
GAVIVPPVTDPGMSRQPPPMPDASTVRPPPMNVDPEAIRKPHPKTGADPMTDKEREVPGKRAPRHRSGPAAGSKNGSGG